MAPILRDYQQEASECAIAALAKRRLATLVVMAIGLGKTVVAGYIIRHFLLNDSAPVLVVVHMRQLVRQLERALWRHLNRDIVTNVVMSGEPPPIDAAGVVVATTEGALGLVEREGFSPQLVFLDETHHVAEEGRYRLLLNLLSSSMHLGMTATPWRGDEYSVEDHYGDPCYRIGIAEGVRRGYLASVDYRLFVDNIDWDYVRSKSAYGYSIKELNGHLFIPARDERIIEELQSNWRRLKRPQAVVFCQTIEHAERMAELLETRPIMVACRIPSHSGVPRRERDYLLAQFRVGRVPLITAVDVFNEGVDIPDVNLLVFLRVTHSRRIFVQQLGRGLRLREGKSHVTVLDFVTDIRRVAAVLNLKRALDVSTGPMETLRVERSSVTFDNEAAGGFLDRWLEDAANVETAADAVRLDFPDFPLSGR